MAYDAFLKIKGITGENADGTINIEAFSFGVTEPRSTGGGGGAGRTTFSDIVITKVVDKTSPQFFAMAVEGLLLPAVQLTFQKVLPAVQGVGATEIGFYKLSNAHIRSIQFTGNRFGDAFPVEEISFSFQKIEFSVSEQRNPG